MLSFHHKAVWGALRPDQQDRVRMLYGLPLYTDSVALLWSYARDYLRAELEKTSGVDRGVPHSDEYLRGAIAGVQAFVALSGELAREEEAAAAVRERGSRPLMPYERDGQMAVAGTREAEDA